MTGAAPSVLSNIRTPRAIDEITPEWLTSILRLAHPDVIVQTCTLQNIMWGMAGKARFSLTYNAVGQGSRLPATMIVKAGFGRFPPEYEWNYTVEVWAYRHVVPFIEANAPYCYYAGIDADGRAVIVMEDLVPRNVSFCNILEPLDYRQASRFLDAYAQIHAKWWGSKEFAPGGQFGFLVNVMEYGDLGAGFWVDHCLQSEVWEKNVRLPRGAAMPRVLRDRSVMQSSLAKLKAVSAKGPWCVTHGDEHLGNLFFESDGRPGFLDWQSKKEVWHLAFGYFLGGALDIDDRRRWEQPLLAYYLERLAAHGVASPPSFDQAWLDYRRSLIWGYLIWLSNPTDCQPEVYEVANTNRFGMAILDHDSFDLF